MRKILIYGAMHVIRDCVDRVKYGNGLDYPTTYRLCLDCDNKEHSSDVKCRRCGNATFHTLMCDTETQTNELTDWLAECEDLWPLGTKQLERSPWQILGTVTDAVNLISPYHQCDGKEECAMRLLKGLMESRVAAVLEQAPGLKLVTYRKLI